MDQPIIFINLLIISSGFSKIRLQSKTFYARQNCKKQNAESKSKPNLSRATKAANTARIYHRFWSVLVLCELGMGEVEV